MNKGCRDAQMAVFFFFHEAGEGVGMERMLCWWLAELLLVVGGASVGEKTKPSFGGIRRSCL